LSAVGWDELDYFEEGFPAKKETRPAVEATTLHISRSVNVWGKLQEHPDEPVQVYEGVVVALEEVVEIVIESVLGGIKGLVNNVHVIVRATTAGAVEELYGYIFMDEGVLEPSVRDGLQSEIGAVFLEAGDAEDGGVPA